MSVQTIPEGPVSALEIPLPASEAPATAPQWVMVARTGAWLGHPTAPGGREVITPARLRSALDYFNRHYRAHGTDLVIDYHHASVLAAPAGGRAPAVGWIRGMELRNGGAELWGRVMWTSQAAAEIAARRFRYLSPVLRFNAPDRVTGQSVPMTVHSMALTNTPFLTELQSLNENDPGRDAPATPREGNEAGAADGAGAHTASLEGGKNMSVLDSLAVVLEQEPEQVASRLGLDFDTLSRSDPGAGDREVAEAIMANSAKPAETESRTSGINGAVVNALGLPEDAGEAEVLNAIGALQQGRRNEQAERIVDAAVEAGRIAPAHRDFYLREAVNDPEAAREVINSLPVLIAPGQGATAAQLGSGAPRRRLSEGELAVCRQLGLTAQVFLKVAE